MSTIMTTANASPKSIVERYLAADAATGATAAIDSGPPGSDETANRAVAEWASARRELVDLIIANSSGRGSVPKLVDEHDRFSEYAVIIGNLLFTYQDNADDAFANTELTITDLSRVKTLA